MTQATEEIKKDDNWSEIGPEVLVEMSAKGEIDPWDVDLVYVIDKFLNKLADRQDKQELKEAARIIFFVSVLLKLKSQRIYQKPNNPPAIGDDDFLDFENIDFEELNSSSAQMDNMLSPKALDSVLSRNSKSIKENRVRKITLDDLLELFKEAELKTARKKKKKKRTLKDFLNDEDLDFGHEDDIVIREDEKTSIMDLAHDEDLEHKIKLLSEYILAELEKDHSTNLNSLQAKIGDWVDTFLAALFLSHSGKTEMSQQEFYQEIWLKRIV